MLDTWRLRTQGRCIIGLVFLLLFAPLQAASLSVNPVVITLDSSGTIAAMTVRNSGADTVVMQAQVNDWSILDNQEHYQPTSSLIVSPPVFEIASGKTQVVRVGLRDTLPQTIEQSFRVFLEQAPAAPSYDSTSSSTLNTPLGVQVMLRIGIPVFVKSAGASTSKLIWSAQRLPDARIRIEAENQGSAHAKITQISVLNKSKTVASNTMLTYILPNSRRHWLLAVPSGITAPYTVKVDTQDGVLEIQIPTSKP
jgi:fimbrial chaperone protein